MATDKMVELDYLKVRVRELEHAAAELYMRALDKMPQYIIDKMAGLQYALADIQTALIQETRNVEGKG